MSTTKTRTEREAELRAMMRTESGKSQLVDLYKQSIGMPMGQGVPPGTLLGQTMIPAILNKEFGVVVNFYTGDGYLTREGTATVRGDEVHVENIEDDFTLSDGEQSMLAAHLRANQICGEIGMYQWRLDD